MIQTPRLTNIQEIGRDLTYPEVQEQHASAWIWTDFPHLKDPYALNVTNGRIAGMNKTSHRKQELTELMIKEYTEEEMANVLQISPQSVHKYLLKYRLIQPKGSRKGVKRGPNKKRIYGAI